MRSEHAQQEIADPHAPDSAERPRARQALLLLLKRSGGLPVQRLAAAIGVTPVAIRKHLDALLRDGLVRADAVKQPRGRPSLIYRLTPAADALFPQGYKQLSLDLIDDLVALEGEPALERLLEARNSRLRDAFFTNKEPTSWRERIDELARLRNADGYMVTVEEQPDAYLIREHNCPIYDVASRHAAACRCEESLFRDVIQQQVIREESLIDGDASCTYRVPKT